MKPLTAIALLAVLAPASRAQAPQAAPVGMERDLIAAVLIAEAGGEGRRGLAAVYEVIWMRAVERKRSLTAVVLQRRQFSCLNRRSPAVVVAAGRVHARWRWVRDELLKHPPLTMYTVPAHLLELNVNRANHYHAARLNPRPAWARGQVPRRVGRHLFYRLTK